MRQLRPSVATLLLVLLPLGGLAVPAVALAQDDDPFKDLFGERQDDRPDDLPDDPYERALRLASRGRYDEAEALLRRTLDEDPEDLEVLQALTRLHLETGRPERATETAATLMELQPEQPAAQLFAGLLAERRGELSAASEAYARAAAPARAARDVLALEALVRLGELAADIDHDQAAQAFSDVLAYYQRAPELSVDELVWIGRACRSSEHFPAVEGRFSRKMSEYDRRMLDQALAIDDERVAIHVEAGALALSKFDLPAAKRSFQRAVELNPNQATARVGLARTLLESFYGGAGKYEDAANELQKALGADPTHPGAHAALARIHATDGDYPAALERLALGRSLRPQAIELLAVQGAVHLLMGEQAAFDALERELLAARPRCARFYVEAAELVQLKFRYAEARDLARKALELDPGYDPALAVLGVNLTRTGAEEEGRAVLKRAFDEDPYDVFVFNHLQLWDRLDEHYQVIERDGFRVRLHKDEVAVTGPYVLDLLIEAREQLGKKYGAVPDEVLVELFADHADFSARSVGLPGIPALGVCFGPVVTVLSAKERETFGAHSWGRTLWHEFAHVATLTRTRNRIPRWFTEGLSVYEEPRGRKTWLREFDRDLITLLRRDLLLPIARLDEGFTKPTYPNQVMMAYYQGGMTCEFIDERWGFEKIPLLLDAYRAGQGTADAIPAVFGVSCEDFDRQFLDFMQRRFGIYAWLPPPSLEERQALLARVEAQPWDVAARGALARAYALHGANADAEAHAGLALRHAEAAAVEWPLLAGGERLLSLPGAAALGAARALAVRAGAGDAQLALALVAQRRGKLGLAMRRTQEALRLGTRDPVLARQLRAAIHRGRKQWKEAIRELEAAGRLSPPSADHHRLLRACWQELGDRERAMAELREVCRLASEDAQSRMEYATWAKEQGRWADVAEVLHDVNLIDPYIPEAHALLGEGLRRTAMDDSAQLERALHELQVALALEVRYQAGPKFGIADCLDRLGREPERVRQLVGEVLRDEPGHAEAKALQERLGPAPR